MVLLGMMVSLSYSSLSFGRFFFMLEVMYLIYLMFKLEAYIFGKYKYGVIAITVAFVVLPQLIVLGYISLFIWLKRRHPKLRNSPSHIQTSVAFLTLITLTTILQHTASFNSFAYAAYSSKLVGIPLTLLIFQHRRASSDDI